MADVLVIGAGAGGAAAAWRLATQGLSVICLEQGGWRAPETGPAGDARWEQLRMGDWNPNPNSRAAPADYPILHENSPISPMVWNGVGGATVLWTAMLPRMHPSDFRMRTLDGVGDDWPLSYTELAPYYDLNEQMTGVAGPANAQAYPPTNAPRLPAAPLLGMEHRMIGAFEQLGWHWWPTELAINTARHGAGRGVCVNCGPCELGCHTRAKASADVVYWPQALAAGARLITGARVAEIVLDAQGRAKGAVWTDRSGIRHVTHASTVVVAANGIGTSRLLMLSGIGNRSGMLGRNLMLHPLARVTGVFDDWVGGHRGNAGGAIASHEFYETDTRRGFVRGVKLQIMRGTGPAATALGQGSPRVAWGRGHHAAFAARFGHTMGVSICSDDLPDPANRIDLAPDHPDSDGMPGARMTYTVGRNSRAALDFGIARATELLRAAGASDTIALDLLRVAGFHLMGTARMGADPDTSVTNRWGELHEVPNLFVADGSLFVTAGAVNPTHTLQALALRQADHIVATARFRTDPT